MPFDPSIDPSEKQVWQVPTSKGDLRFVYNPSRDLLGEGQHFGTLGCSAPPPLRVQVGYSNVYPWRDTLVMLSGIETGAQFISRKRVTEPEIFETATEAIEAFQKQIVHVWGQPEDYFSEQVIQQQAVQGSLPISAGFDPSKKTNEPQQWGVETSAGPLTFKFEPSPSIFHNSTHGTFWASAGDKMIAYASERPCEGDFEGLFYLSEIRLFEANGARRGLVTDYALFESRLDAAEAFQKQVVHGYTHPEEYFPKEEIQADVKLKAPKYIPLPTGEARVTNDHGGLHSTHHTVSFLGNDSGTRWWLGSIWVSGAEITAEGYPRADILESAELFELLFTYSLPPHPSDASPSSDDQGPFLFETYEEAYDRGIRDILALTKPLQTADGVVAPGEEVQADLGISAKTLEEWFAEARSEDWEVRYGVAANPNTPPQVLIELSKDKASGVRYGVARNPNTPPQVLIELSKDEDRDVRNWVAANPNTPPQVLIELSKDEDWGVRYEVAANPNTPPQVLIELSKDEDWGVRYRVATNPNIPPMPEFSKELNGKTYTAKFNDQNLEFFEQGKKLGTLLIIYRINLGGFEASGEGLPTEAFETLEDIFHAYLKEILAVGNSVAGELTEDVSRSTPPEGFSQSHEKYVDPTRHALRELRNWMVKTGAAEVRRNQFNIPELSKLKDKASVKTLLDRNNGVATLAQVEEAIKAPSGQKFYVMHTEYGTLDQADEAFKDIPSRSMSLSWDDVDGLTPQIKKFIDTVVSISKHQDEGMLGFAKRYGWVLFKHIPEDRAKALGIDTEFYLVEQVQSDWPGVIPSFRKQAADAGPQMQQLLRDKFESKFGGPEGVDEVQRDLRRLMADYPAKLLSAFLDEVSGKLVFMTGKAKAVELADLPETEQGRAQVIYDSIPRKFGFTDSTRLPGYMETIAAALTLSAKTLEEWFAEARSEDWEVRSEVAANPNTPPQVLIELSKDEDRDVRYGVARNPNTPPQVLIELSKDEDRGVRYEVAANPNTPPQVLIELSKDKASGVRYGVARNPNTPPMPEFSKELNGKTYTAKFNDENLEFFEQGKKLGTLLIIYRINLGGFEASGEGLPTEAFETLEDIFHAYLKEILAVGNSVGAGLALKAEDDRHIFEQAAAFGEQVFQTPLGPVRVKVGDTYGHDESLSGRDLVRLDFLADGWFPGAPDICLVTATPSGGAYNRATHGMYGESLIEPFGMSVLTWSPMESFGYTSGIDRGGTPGLKPEDMWAETLVEFAELVSVDVAKQLAPVLKEYREAYPDRFINAADAATEARKAEWRMRNQYGWLDDSANIPADVRERAQVAADTTTDPEELDLLSYSRDWAVRERVARNANTAEDALARLLLDDDSDVRNGAEYVAYGNGGRITSPEILRRLLLYVPQTSKQARMVAVTNPNTPPEALVEFFKANNSSGPHNASDIHEAALAQPFLPAEAVHYLFFSSTPSVCELAAKHPNLPELPKTIEVWKKTYPVIWDKLLGGRFSVPGVIYSSDVIYYHNRQAYSVFWVKPTFAEDLGEASEHIDNYRAETLEDILYTVVREALAYKASLEKETDDATEEAL